MKKKRRPRDIIESTGRPHLESTYVKYSGKELKHNSQKRNRHGVVIKPTNKEDYLDVHTHPYDPKKIEILRERYWMEDESIVDASVTLPSLLDLRTWLENKNLRTGVIVARDINTGKTKNSFILRKTKKTPKEISGLEIIKTATGEMYLLDDFLNSNYRKEIGKPVELKFYDLEDLAEALHLQYRQLDDKGRTLKYISYNPKSVRDKARGSKSNLESEVVAAAGFFLISIFFLSFRINGFAILNIPINSYNPISIMSLLASLIFIILFLRKKNNLKKSKSRRKK